jgi:DNA-binding beta-propeller fold protein YncE
MACTAYADEPALVKTRTIALQGPVGKIDHVLVDGEQNRLFLAHQANNSLDVVDLKTGTVIKQVPNQTKIKGIGFAADLNRIFTGNGGGASAAIDGKDYSVLKTHDLPDADNVRYDARTQRFYIQGDKVLHVIDAKSLEAVTKIDLPGPLEAFQIESKRPRLYINTTLPGQVVVIDTDKNAIVERYPLGVDKGNDTLAIDEANHRLLVGCRGGNSRVIVLDSESGKEVATAPIPDGVDDIFLDAKRGLVYASCGTGFIAVIRQVDADHYQALEKIATVKTAKTSFFDPISGRLYLGVPRQPDTEGPQIWVYEPRR